MSDNCACTIREGRASLGIELGSTRVKAVLIGEDHKPLASGNYDWENKLEGGYWTYGLDDVWEGLRQSYAGLVRDARERYGVGVSKLRGFGISAMMHGYLAFDAAGNLLVPFRTWRNTTTEKAAAELTKLFNFNVPLRWSVSHLYQAVLDGEAHLGEVAYVTTLSGYVHWALTGRKVLGVGDASGMFPIDCATGGYNGRMADLFDGLVESKGYNFKLRELFPAVVPAGADAGFLTEKGARLLDPEARLPGGAEACLPGSETRLPGGAGCALRPGVPMCPPEGDAGTGMVATNSVAERTGNVSAGTSIFAMAVMDKELEEVYPEIDVITTPDGKPVAMVHCNNCTSDIDAWARLFAESCALFGAGPGKSELYEKLYGKALDGEPGCGGLLTYNYVSGEPITGFESGRPLFARTQGARFTLANLMRSLLFSAVASLKIGMDILLDKEGVRLTHLTGHGGLFKAKNVGQRLVAAALSIPVAVMESAGEGGAWGMAILAAYRAAAIEAGAPGSAAAAASDATVANAVSFIPLSDYLATQVFAGSAGAALEPDPGDARGFAEYMGRYVPGLAIEKAAVENLRE